MLCLFHKFIFSEIFETKGEEIQEAAKQPASSLTRLFNFNRQDRNIVDKFFVTAECLNTTDD